MLNSQHDDDRHSELIGRNTARVVLGVGLVLVAAAIVWHSAIAGGAVPWADIARSLGGFVIAAVAIWLLGVHQRAHARQNARIDEALERGRSAAHRAIDAERRMDERHRH